MPANPNPAVFLSYASQDAELVQRIVAALRAAGVEVWFDQNELVGGDAWDAKIRGQIASCALFVPVVSAATQARLEGYFRLEWKLAAQRTHTMADERTFLLPVVIDDTRDADAKVPGEFRAVQWTRLPGGEGPMVKKFCARVGKLLGGEAVGPIADRAAGSEVGAPLDGAHGRGRATPLRKPARQWLWPAVAAAVMLGGIVVWRAELKPPASAPAPGAAVKIIAPLSPARELAERASAMSLKKYNSTADDFAAAEGLIKQALALDQNDAQIWAISSHFNGSIRTRGFDDAPARREAARSQAERALKLDPNSIEGLFALGRWQRDNDSDRAVAEKTFLAVLARAPEHDGALQSLGTMYGRQNRVEEALAIFERAARNPASLPLARCGQYVVLFSHRRFEEAERALRESIAAESSANAVTGLAMVLLTAKGDAAAAVRALAGLPAPNRSEHRAVWMTAFAQLAARDPEAALATLRRLSADYVQDNWFAGPTAYWVGRAHSQAGRAEAARIAFEAGLTVMDAKLKTGSDDYALHVARGELLAWLGREEEALREARTATELAGGDEIRLWFYSPVRIYAALGRADEAVPLLEKFAGRNPRAAQWPLTPALLRLDPLWDKLRGDARFQALCAEPSAPSVAAPPKVDSKSVAVLAFANLSDDKGNEYFSDGISEELLNVLAKVPQLKVAARTSSFSFKGRNAPIPEIARQLTVAYVVEGSVRKAGNKVRITAQLIKAADGFHVWSETYDRDLTDIFAVQDEIAKKILGIVKGSLLGEAELPRAVTTKPEAYALFLQAQGQLALRGETGMVEAERLFVAALAIDPDYVPALVGLARTGFLLPTYVTLSGPKARLVAGEAKQAAQRALELDPRNAGALAAHGSVLSMNEWRWAEGEAELLQARELAPNDAWVANLTGDYFLYTGNLPAALAAKRKWQELDPLSAVSHWDLGFANIMARDYDQAILWGERAMKLAPTRFNPYLVIVLAAGRAGRFDLMRRTLAAARRDVRENEGDLLLFEAYGAIMEKRLDEAHRIMALVTPRVEKGEVAPAPFGYCHLLLGDSDQALTWLQRGYEQRDSWLTFSVLIDFADLAANPKTRPLLDLPRLKELYEIRQRNARIGAGKP